MKKNFVIFGVIAGVILACIFALKHFDFSLESTIILLWEKYVADFGYYILFGWSVLEGELGLIFAGLAAHTGHLNVWLAIFIAGLGGFVGDQIYFYIGRCNKKFIQKRLKSQSRKFALATVLLQKYGWSIIFVQRYMYGMRTIIPISIGLTRYSAAKFAIINLISAWIWAAITILLAWHFGDQILNALKFFKNHPYIFVLLAATFLITILWYFKKQAAKKPALKTKEKHVKN